MMPETVILLVREGVGKLLMLAICFVDNRYPSLGSGIYYGVLKYLAKGYARKSIDAAHNALMLLSRSNPF